MKFQILTYKYRWSNVYESSKYFYFNAILQAEIVKIENIIFVINSVIHSPKSYFYKMPD